MDPANEQIIDLPNKPEASEKLKEKANDLYRNKHYELAAEKYTEAIEIFPTAVLYSNRSAANLQLELYGYALADATKAIEMDPEFVKAYFRRASANLALDKLKDARKDFLQVVKLKPNEKGARDKLAEIEKTLKRLAFEKAIEAEVAVPIADTLDVNALVPATGYELDVMPWPLTRDYVLSTMQAFKDQKKIDTNYVYRILLEAKKVFEKLPNVIDVKVPESNKFTVCGDIHGQYYDLLKIFELNGYPSEDNPYVFNGDFVDRGSFSVECILTLFLWKILSPNCIHLTRGNHESKNMNQMFGFAGEVKAKYSDRIYQFFGEVFCTLPLCVLLEEKILVLHGGLFSDDNTTIETIRKLNRFSEPPASGPMVELLWSDPANAYGRTASKRGVGVAFGPDVTKKFLERNGLKLLIRSHEMKEAGYEYCHDNKCMTIFSAPNYCDQMGNKGAFINFAKDLVPKITSFTAAPHPDIKPMAYMPALSQFSF